MTSKFIIEIQPITKLLFILGVCPFSYKNEKFTPTKFTFCFTLIYIILISSLSIYVSRLTVIDIFKSTFYAGLINKLSDAISECMNLTIYLTFIAMSLYDRNRHVEFLNEFTSIELSNFYDHHLTNTFWTKINIYSGIFAIFLYIFVS